MPTGESNPPPHLKKEDVSALHAGVEYLGSRHFLGVRAPHDLAAPHDALHVVVPRHVHHQRPILRRPLIDLIASTYELRKWAGIDVYLISAR